MLNLEAFGILKNSLSKPDFKPDAYDLDLLRIAVDERIENMWKELRKSKRPKPQMFNPTKYSLEIIKLCKESEAHYGASFKGK